VKATGGELAWRVKDLPASLRRLPKDLQLLAKGRYNGAVLAGDPEPGRRVLDQLQNEWARKVEQAVSVLESLKGIDQRALGDGADDVAQAIADQTDRVEGLEATAAIIRAVAEVQDD